MTKKTNNFWEQQKEMADNGEHAYQVLQEILNARELAQIFVDCINKCGELEKELHDLEKSIQDCPSQDYPLNDLLLIHLCSLSNARENTKALLEVLEKRIPKIVEGLEEEIKEY
jgi:hypothetical protein